MHFGRLYSQTATTVSLVLDLFTEAVSKSLSCKPHFVVRQYDLELLRPPLVYKKKISNTHRSQSVMENLRRYGMECGHLTVEMVGKWL